MKTLFKLLLILGLGFPAYGGNTDTLNVVVDLELKITQKIRSVIHPVDPDAIVFVNVDIKKVDTDLIGTQMTAVGMMTTSDFQKVDDADIAGIQVSILTTLNPFPKEVAKIVENSVLAISKKGKVAFSQMDAATAEAILKTKEHRKIQSDNFQKIGKYAEQLYKLIAVALGSFLIGLAITQFIMTVIEGRARNKATDKLVSGISSLKLEGAEGSGGGRAMEVVAAPSASNDGSGSKGGAVTASEDNVFEKLPVESLKALLSDAYWCSKDGYASWVWTQLSPEKKLKILDSWEVFAAYTMCLNQIPPVADRYHDDPHYLKPESYFHLSNEDLLSWIQEKKYLWSELSFMRRQSLKVSLKDRIEMLNWTGKKEKATWKNQASPLRTLPQQLEITTLSPEDESMVYASPDLLKDSLRKQFTSLIWVALLPKEQREKLLQQIPAQGLAEIWSGPEEVLKKIEEVLPEKKRQMLADYRKRMNVKKNSPWMKSLSDEAVRMLEESPTQASSSSGQKQAA